MIVNADAKALEWWGAVYLSKDKVGYHEVRNKIDQHTLNQNAWKLPSRLLAKTFVFRLIYGGSAYSYANDARFAEVSTDEAFWQEIIDQFYAKYTGIAEWHEQLMHEAMSTGFVRIPTGRQFPFEPMRQGRQMKWPRTQILNYPVQGFGADLMVLARVVLWRDMAHLRDKIKWVCTVHDSIVWDVPEELVQDVAQLIFAGWRKLPQEFERVFGVELDLPPTVEVKYGPTWAAKEEIFEQYANSN